MLCKGSRHQTSIKELAQMKAKNTDYWDFISVEQQPISVFSLGDGPLSP